MSFCMYHSEFSTLFNYPQDVYERLKIEIKDRFKTVEVPEQLKRETVISVEFNPYPTYGTRFITDRDKNTVLDSKTGYTAADDKKRYPSIFGNEFIVGIKTDKRELFFEVYELYRWNNADILGPIQIVAMCGKDDRRIILGSGIHDYLLEYRQQIFKSFKEQDKSLTLDEFRWITSDTFRYLIESQGMEHNHACRMANVMDCFQKHFQKKKWSVCKN